MKTAREKNYTKHISAVISEEDYEKLQDIKQAACEDFRIKFSMGDILRDAIRDYIKSQRLTHESQLNG